jgi:hypothetical protein
VPFWLLPFPYIASCRVVVRIREFFSSPNEDEFSQRDKKSTVLRSYIIVSIFLCENFTYYYTRRRPFHQRGRSKICIMCSNR